MSKGTSAGLGEERKRVDWSEGGVEGCGFLEEYRYLFPLDFDSRKVGRSCPYMVDDLGALWVWLQFKLRQMSKSNRFLPYSFSSEHKIS